MKSWKTTLGGIGAILVSVGAALGLVAAEKYAEAMAAVPGIIAGFGLLFARDNDVTSEDVGIK